MFICLLTVCLPALGGELHGATLSVDVALSPSTNLGQGLAHSKCSLNQAWMCRWMDEHQKEQKQKKLF